MTPKWFFLGVLTQPYCVSPQGNPVYLDGFDFVGLVSLQETSTSWPGTAGLVDQTVSVLQAYTESTKVTKIIMDDDEDEVSNHANSIKVVDNGLL